MTSDSLLTFLDEKLCQVFMLRLILQGFMVIVIILDVENIE